MKTSSNASPVALVSAPGVDRTSRGLLNSYEVSRTADETLRFVEWDQEKGQQCVKTD